MSVPASFIIWLTLMMGIFWAVMAIYDDYPRNIDAYNAGYNELNETKYKVACDIVDDWYAYTDDQVEYAGDYKHGFEARLYDEKYNLTQNHRNETLNILGTKD